ncbi:hypothetical protein ACFQ9U_08050 [Streptomyces sp. NPDC056568]|uniref:hypothetical protein n=1 Tax=Streptomyces sp. NPDC056568 TaxID=3345866 RepID=UPI0036C69ED3
MPTDRAFSRRAAVGAAFRSLAPSPVEAAGPGRSRVSRCGICALARTASPSEVVGMIRGVLKMALCPGADSSLYAGPVIRRRRTRLGRSSAVSVIIVVCLVTVGIGVAAWSESEGDGDVGPSATPVVRKLPVVVDAEEPELVAVGSERSEMGLPPASAAASLTERVLGEIQEKTLVMTAIHSRVTAGCEGGQVTPKAGHKTLCTVTYRSVKLTWDVWVSDVSDSGPSQLIRYDVYPPDSGVLLAKAVYGRFWEQHHNTAKEMRCDRIPALRRAGLGGDTGYECQYLDADDDAAHWVRKKVLFDTGGPVFQEIE